jgi:RNA polymerase sigma factor (sigma-70 family)
MGSPVPPDRDFVALCTEVGPRLLRALTAQVGDPLLAEELAQDALARVAARWPSLRDVDRPDLYALRVGANVAASWWRRRAVERRALARLHAGELASYVDPDGATSVALRTAVAALPRRQREAVALRYGADLAVRDAAVVMGCSEGTVKALTHQAIVGLRVALGDDVDGEGDGDGIVRAGSGGGGGG